MLLKRYKKIVDNYIWRVVQFFFKSFVPLFINFYGAKILMPNDFGKIVYLLTIISIINLFSNFGISTSALKTAAENNNKGDIQGIKNIFPSTYIISLIIILPVSIIVFSILKEDFKFLLFCLPYLVFNPIASILDGIYVGVKKIKSLAISTSIVSVISVLASYFLIKNLQKEGILLSYSLYYFLLFVFIYSKFPFKKGHFSKTMAINIMKYAFVIGLGSISFFLYSKFDIIILKSFNYIKEIGHYELIMRVFQIVTIPVVLIGQVLSPYFIKLNQNNEIKRIQNYSLISAFSLFLFGTIVAIVLYFIIPPLIKSFYPAYYSPEFISIMSIMISTFPLKFVGLFMTNGIITPLGYAKIITYTTLIFGFINIILDIIFIKLFGFIGIFWVTFIVHNINILVQYLLFWNKLKIKLRTS